MEDLDLLERTVSRVRVMMGYGMTRDEIVAQLEGEDKSPELIFFAYKGAETLNFLGQP